MTEGGDRHVRDLLRPRRIAERPPADGTSVILDVALPGTGSGLRQRLYHLMPEGGDRHVRDLLRSFRVAKRPAADGTGVMLDIALLGTGSGLRPYLFQLMTEGGDRHVRDLLRPRRIAERPPADGTSVILDVALPGTGSGLRQRLYHLMPEGGDRHVRDLLRPFRVAERPPADGTGVILDVALLGTGSGLRQRLYHLMPEGGDRHVRDLLRSFRVAERPPADGAKVILDIARFNTGSVFCFRFFQVMPGGRDFHRKGGATEAGAGDLTRFRAGFICRNRGKAVNMVRQRHTVNGFRHDDRRQVFTHLPVGVLVVRVHIVDFFAVIDPAGVPLPVIRKLHPLEIKIKKTLPFRDRPHNAVKLRDGLPVILARKRVVAVIEGGVDRRRAHKHQSARRIPRPHVRQQRQHAADQRSVAGRGRLAADRK